MARANREQQNSKNQRGHRQRGAPLRGEAANLAFRFILGEEYREDDEDRDRPDVNQDLAESDKLRTEVQVNGGHPEEAQGQSEGAMDQVSQKDDSERPRQDDQRGDGKADHHEVP